MSQETLKMSRKERQRLGLMSRVKLGELLLKEAAYEMGVTARQAVRIKKRFEANGAEGLVHRSRGMPSNNSCTTEFRRRVLKIYRERYGDFGPTLACEKMAEYDGVTVNRETLRLWLIGDSQWRVGQKERVHRRQRKRRKCFGELLQIDGSDHAWFEERGPRCTLMVIIDDARGKIVLHMATGETSLDALIVLRKWVAKHGVPGSIYADRNNVYFTDEFVQNRERRTDPSTFTKFMKVTDRLNIQMIPAYSAQAKGRVERMNRLLQDRLVKELRLRGIDTIDGANAMLAAYAEEINSRFAKAPASQADAHRSAPKGRDQWEYFFCFEETRKVQRDNTVVFENEIWQILEQEGGPKPGDTVTRRTTIPGLASYWLQDGRRLKTKHIGRAKSRSARGEQYAQQG
jgi:hypothetical protein